MARRKPTKDAKPDAWMPLYIGDLLVEAGHLSTEQFGAYVLLLAHLWKRGGQLPAHAGQLRALARLDPDPWRDAWPLLFPLFEDRGDHLTHRRLSPEYAWALERYDKLLASSAAGVAARGGPKGEPNGQPNGHKQPSGEPNGQPSGEPFDEHNHNHNHKKPTPTTGGGFEPEQAVPFTALVDAARAGLTGAGAAAVALRKAGVSVTSQNPDLLAALTAGVTPDHLVELSATYPGKPIKYLCSAAMREVAERGTIGIPGNPGAARAPEARRPDGVSPKRPETAATRLEGAISYADDMLRRGRMTASEHHDYLLPYQEAADAAPDDQQQ